MQLYFCIVYLVPIDLLQHVDRAKHGAGAAPTSVP